MTLEGCLTCEFSRWQQNDAGQATNEPEKQEEDLKKEQKEIVIKAPQSQVIPNLIMTYNIPLLNNKQNPMNGRKSEEQKTETTKKVVVRKQTQALFL